MVAFRAQTILHSIFVFRISRWAGERISCLVHAREGCKRLQGRLSQAGVGIISSGTLKAIFQQFWNIKYIFTLSIIFVIFQNIFMVEFAIFRDITLVIPPVLFVLEMYRCGDAVLIFYYRARQVFHVIRK